MKNSYPELLARRFTAYNVGAVVFAFVSIVQWKYMDFGYASLLGVMVAIYMQANNIKLRSRIRKKGFQWRQYKVIAYTALSRHSRKPTGVLVLSLNDDEPITRYHFALPNKIEIPRVGDALEFCVPCDARIKKIGRTKYISEYYGIKRNGRPL